MLLILAGCKIPLSKVTVSHQDALLKFHIATDNTIQYSNSKVYRRDSLSRLGTEDPRAVRDR